MDVVLSIICGGVGKGHNRVAVSVFLLSRATDCTYEWDSMLSVVCERGGINYTDSYVKRHLPSCMKHIKFCE